VITFGADRELARRRMVEALGEFSLLGVAHTGAFLQAVIASEQFAHAELSTRFIPDYFPHWRNSDQAVNDAVIAALLLAEGLLGDATPSASRRNGTLDHSSSATRSPWADLTSFTLGGIR
jgi:geranyl-CoA carboxylase alpha subunit